MGALLCHCRCGQAPEALPELGGDHWQLPMQKMGAELTSPCWVQPLALSFPTDAVTAFVDSQLRWEEGSTSYVFFFQVPGTLETGCCVTLPRSEF